MATATDHPRAPAGQPPEQADEWLGVLHGPLPVTEAALWAVVPRCGAVVTFTGTVRDHSLGRPDVSELVYEAYEEMVAPTMAGIAEIARQRWPDVGRIVMLHRTGRLTVTEAAVVVAVSAPHRQAAFDAAHFCIDTVKATVPIWKREVWRGGEDWGACHLEGDGPGSEPGALPSGTHRHP